MAKTPSKTGSPPAAGTAKPKAAKPKTARPAASSTTIKKPAVARKAAKQVPDVTSAPKPAFAKVAKPAKIVKSDKKTGRKSLLQEASTTITRLASDIVADRVVPTIEQIKAVAESLLTLAQGKSRKSKKTKK